MAAEMVSVACLTQRMCMPNSAYVRGEWLFPGRTGKRGEHHELVVSTIMKQSIQKQFLSKYSTIPSFASGHFLFF